MSLNNEVLDVTERVRRGFCEGVQAIELDSSTWSIVTPFLYGDGDGFPVILERLGDRWRLTDRGVALNRWFYDHDDYDVSDHLDSVERLIESFGLALVDRSIRLDVPNGAPPTAYEIAYFIRAIAAVDTLPRTQRERTPPFSVAVRSHIKRWIPGHGRESAWTAPQDAKGLYPVDFRISTRDESEPVLLFIVGNTARANLTFGILKQLSGWEIKGARLVAWNAEASIAQNAVDRLTDQTLPGAVFPLRRSDDDLLRRRIQEFGVRLFA